MVLDWKLNHICNYRCSYCYNQSNWHNKMFPTLENIRKGVSHLNKDWEYIVILSGGEITLYPYLFQFLQELKELKIKSLQLITNGSASIQYYKDLIKLYKNILLYISIHPEFVDSNHILSLVNEVQGLCKIYLAFMYFEPYINKYFDLVEKVTELGISNNFILIRKPPLYELFDSYPQEVTKKVIDHNYNILYNQEYCWKNNNTILYKNLEHTYSITNGLLKTRNFSCCSGTSLIDIQVDGTVNGTICNYGTKSLGSFYQLNPFKSPRFVYPVICKAKNCACRNTLIIPKFKDKQNAVEYCKKIRSLL